MYQLRDKWKPHFDEFSRSSIFTAVRGYFIKALWIENAVIVCSAIALSIAVIYHHRYRQAKYEDDLLRVLDEAFEEPS